ncbi:MAG: hypothetical protein AB7G37_00025 [Solirubrobacteraceae bacterium]
MNLSPGRIVAVLVALVLLVAAGGPGGVRDHAADLWHTVQDQIDGPVPDEVPLPEGLTDRAHRLTSTGASHVAEAEIAIGRICVEVRGMGTLSRSGSRKPQRDALLATLDRPMGVLATIFGRDPQAIGTDGPLRDHLTQAAATIGTTCADHGRAEQLERTITRADRRS